ncbi:MAG: [protein-PII] uridylyltransferase [Firmicutes bacterium]|nr:[protein-PII] uridylyltransferase [Bacillota bacterium]
MGPANITEKYTDGLARLKKEYFKKPTGRELARKHSDFIDSIIIELFNKALGDPNIKVNRDAKGIAVIAIGGYGRQELCPFSDIDLMVLHNLQDSAFVTRISEKLFYPLWDLGLQVGHGTRTVKESLNLALTNFKLQTALLDARLITGDIDLFNKLKASIVKQVRLKGGKKFLQSVLNESANRYRQYGQAAYLLEPDIKEGEGGLRDIHAIFWVSKGILGCTSTKELVESGYLTEFDAETLEDGLEFLLMVRNHLHYVAGRENDRLFFEHQLEISRSLGFKDENGISGIEKFMRSFYTHASAIELISRSFWEQISSDFLTNRRIRFSASKSITKDGIVVSKGMLSILNPQVIIKHPGTDIKIFKQAIKEKLLIDYKRLNLIREGLEKSENPATWTQDILDDFIDIISSGEDALASLEVMDYIGILSRYIPEWSYIRCLPQYDSYHLYTVDMHLFLTVAELKRIGIGKYDIVNPLLKQVYIEIKQKDLLFLVGLLHDIGKGLGKDHSKKGERIAKKICSRMGLPAKDCDTVGFLVGNHLLLSDTATRRDLNDENVIIDLAKLIISEERLKMLYLISVADSLATGPKAWDTWKDNLLRELFYKVIHIIRSGEYTSKKSIESIRKISKQVKQTLIPEFSEEEVNRFLDQMPHSYLLAQDSDSIVEHFKQMRRAKGTGISITTKDKEGLQEIILIAKDQPGLFYKVSGALALHGINILGAQIYTRSDGIVLDIFKVKGYFEHNIDKERWSNIIRDIKRALEGKIALDYRIADKADRYKSNKALNKPPQVKIDNSSSDFYTVIEVHVQDRIGLLYTITKVMHDLSLNIHLAKVSTDVDKVIDVFYVWDIYGQKISDNEQIGDIKKAILAALE